jgi:hypothetical protein
MIQTISILFEVDGSLCPSECITEFEHFQALNQEIMVTLQTLSIEIATGSSLDNKNALGD